MQFRKSYQWERLYAEIKVVGLITESFLMIPIASAERGSLVIVFGERRGVELSMKEIRVEKVTGATGSRGDVFVVRTSKLVENP